MSQCERIEARVYGRVQGVGFRYSTELQASKRGLSGWVCNARDGSVVVVAEGEPTALQSFEAWLHEGPAMSQVHRVHIDRFECRGMKHFSIRHDCV